MLSDKELEDLLVQQNLTSEARNRIRWIRENAPIRPVGGGSHNTPCRFSSRKMGFVHEAEAFNTEYAAFEDYDNDDSVLEYYSQPCQLRIIYVNNNGKRVHPDITPDIFVISRDYCAFVECKTEEELLRLAKDQPNRFIVDEEGRWRSPPAEIAAAELGCRFIVRSSKDNNWIAIENYEFFSDYLRVEPCDLKISPEALSVVEKRLSTSSWLTVRDLLHGEEPIDADSVYALIVRKKVFFDFQTNRISNPDQALLFRDQVTATAYRTVARTSVGLRTPGLTPFEARPGQRFSWDGRPWQVINVGDTHVSFMPLQNDGHALIAELDFENVLELCRSGKIVPHSEEKDGRADAADELLKKAGTKKLQVALWRYQILFGTPDATNPLTGKKARAQAYWLASYRAAELEFGVGLVGLINNPKNTQGNHNRKCDPQAYALAIQAYETYWETDAQRSAVLCYGFYTNLCASNAVTPIGLKSFEKLIKSFVSHEQTRKRLGEKAAYSEEPPYLVLEYTTPRHGNRPFHIGHIDHTPLPIKIRDKSGTYVLRTVWLTILIDAFSRNILAVYLSFDPPSYRSCMMVIRECVRKHGRIPHWIVVDNGSDFQSIYFETLIARLGSHKKDRPKGKPKFGSVIERFFSTAIDQFISNLLGATHDMDPRQVGRDVDPALKAVWTLERLWARLNEFLTTVYHRNIHSTLGESPEACLVKGLETFGHRPQTVFSYTKDFFILTCPSTAKGSAKVTGRGVKINYLYYRCPAMDLAGVLNSRVPVRYDPDNLGTAYVQIQNDWHECYSEYYAIFQTYTEKQIRIVTAHIHLMARISGRQVTVNAQVLASFLQSAAAEEVLGLQRRQDNESSSIRAAINTTIDHDPLNLEIVAQTTVVPSDTDRDFKPVVLEDF